MDDYKTYDHWDELMASRNPDYIALCTEMHTFAYRMVTDDVDLLWRLSAATFGTTQNMDFDKERDYIEFKTAEAKQYAEKALRLAPCNFNANLWMCKCLGQLISMRMPADLEGPSAKTSMTNKLEELVPMFELLLHHLKWCTNPEPTRMGDDWQVMLLEAQLNLMQIEIRTYHLDSNALHNCPMLMASLKSVDLATAENNLYDVVEIKPYLIEAHFALTKVLFEERKFGEALTAARKCLSLERITLADHCVARNLEQLLPTIIFKANNSGTTNTANPRE